MSHNEMQGRLVLRPALLRLLKGEQLGMFGGAAPGKKLKVKQHIRRTKQGTTLVQEHERAAREARPEDEPPPKPEPEAEVEDQAAAPTPEPEADTGGGFRLTAPGEHEDVGPTVWGARKHKWQAKDGVNPDNLDDLEDRGEGDALKYVTKRHVGIEHDADTDRGNGSSAGASYLKKHLIAAIAAKPRVLDDPEAGLRQRRLYVDGWDWLHHELDSLHTVTQVKEFLEEWRLLNDGKKLSEEIVSGLDLFEKYGQEPGAFSSWISINTLSPAESAEWKQLKARKWNPATPLSDDETERWKDLRDRSQRRLNSHKLRAAGLSDNRPREVRDVDGRLHGYRMYVPSDDGSTYWDFMDALDGSGERLWNIVQARKGAFWKKHTGIAGQMERDDDWSKLDVKRKKGGKATRAWKRAVEGNVRIGGPEVRTGNYGDDLQKTFGIKHVQHGKNVKQSDRGAHIDLTFAAFADLADILGIDPKMIAHGGRLSIAFGARGGGRFAAHYEPGAILRDEKGKAIKDEDGKQIHAPIINITNTRGNGSLAHEWAHFFDHQLTEDPYTFIAAGDRKRAPFVSHREGQGALHTDVATALNEVMRQIHTAPPAQRADRRKAYDARSETWSEAVKVHNQKAKRRPGQEGGYATREEQQASYDELKAEQAYLKAAAGGGNKSTYAEHAGMLGGYWSRPHEMFARAFESFVEDELEAAERKNTYLVAGTNVDYGIRRAKFPKEKLEPYPRGDDRKRINDAFRALVAAMREHHTLEKALRRAMSLVPPYDPWR
jgi:hypothetical protein